jgi:hypothetical protein
VDEKKSYICTLLTLWNKTHIQYKLIDNKQNIDIKQLGLTHEEAKPILEIHTCSMLTKEERISYIKASLISWDKTNVLNMLLKCLFD